MNPTIFQISPELEDSLKRITRSYVNNGLIYGWKSNSKKSYDYGHWNRQILKESQTAPYDHGRMPWLPRHPHVHKIWQHIQSLIGDRALLRCYINGYTYGTDGYAHTDDQWITDRFGSDSVSETVIVYLNEKWDHDWAGETVIFDDNKDIEISVLPKFGRIFVFNSDRWHAARPVTRTCPELRAVLVFKTFDLRYISPEIALILEKTKDLPHSGKTFFEHLHNVMAILERRKEKREVRIAGLYHSIYGTEYYNFNDPMLNRDVVRAIIGEYAERLVYEFCTVKNRLATFLENSPGYEPEFRKDLLRIELANLTDQNTNNKHDATIQKIENALKE